MQNEPFGRNSVDLDELEESREVLCQVLGKCNVLMLILLGLGALLLISGLTGDWHPGTRLNHLLGACVSGTGIPLIFAFRVWYQSRIARLDETIEAERRTSAEERSLDKPE